MSEQPYTVEQVLSILAESPPRLAALSEGVSAEQLRTRPDPDQWSAVEVLAHLRACADVWGGCIARILAEDNPTWRALSPRTYIHKTDYPQLEFQPSLAAFTSQRNDLLAILAALPPESWQRAATVKGVGRNFENTVLYYGDRMARHERPHVGQIEQTIDALNSA